VKRKPRWGLLCPLDGGILLSNPDWGERLWCPSNGHGGNGRFFDPTETQEGLENVAGAGLTAAQEAALAEVGTEAAPAPARPRTAKGEATETKRAPRSRDPRQCECGCEGMTKGGRFLPGHDAKMHARQKAEAVANIDGQPI
jgi:hypothetical protein